MSQKKLEPDSKYGTQLDLNNDGVVDDTEIAALEAVEKAEKMDAQKRMAWTAMIAMIFFTCAVFLPIFSDTRIKALADLFALFYIGMGSVIGAYMGATAYMSKGR